MRANDRPDRRRWLAAVAAVALVIAGIGGIWWLGAADRAVAPSEETPPLAQGTWTIPSPAPLSARQHPHVLWTGTRFIVWGGVVGNTGLADGALYDPATDTWSTIPPNPGVRPGAPAVWAGDRMVVMGDLGGEAFDPSTRTWTSLPDLDGVEAGSGFTDVAWSGDTLLGIGIHRPENDATATLTTWQLDEDRWVEAGTFLTTGEVPSPRYVTVADQTSTHSPIATDDGFVLWGDSAGWRFTIDEGWTAIPPLASYHGGVIVRGLQVVWFQDSLMAVANGQIAQSSDLRLATLGPSGWSEWTVIGEVSRLIFPQAIVADDHIVVLHPTPLLVTPASGSVVDMTEYPLQTGITQGVGWSGTTLLVWGGQTSADNPALADGSPGISGQAALWAPSDRDE